MATQPITPPTAATTADVCFDEFAEAADTGFGGCAGVGCELLELDGNAVRSDDGMGEGIIVGCVGATVGIAVG